MGPHGCGSGVTGNRHRMGGSEMNDTGRSWFVIEGEDELLKEEPMPPLVAAKWTEVLDEDGELWYVSDHEGYTLDAEEFGPIPEDERHNREHVMMRPGCAECEARYQRTVSKS